MIFVIQNYLSNRLQRTKMNYLYSSWSYILIGIQQDSILEPILFNTFLSDLSLVINDVNIAGYADDNTIYDSRDSIDGVITSVQISFKKLFQWISADQMQGDSDKCHFVTNTNESHQILVDDSSIGSSSFEKLLEVKIDPKLTFHVHVKDICQNASKKLRALARATLYTRTEKKKLLVNSFFSLQFNCCPLTWMLHSFQNNNIVKDLCKRCLWLIYNDKLAIYDQLLLKDGSIPIYYRNIQNLAIEMFKVKNYLSPIIVTGTFFQQAQTQYNLGYHNDFGTPGIRSV